MTAPRPPGNRPTSQRPAAGAKPQGMQSLVQAIVDEQQQKKAEFKQALQRPVKRAPLGPVALVILVLLNAAAWFVFPPPRDTDGDLRTPIEIERDLRVVIAAVAGEIEVWRSTHEGRLPASLSEVGVADSTIGYALTDSVTYELRGSDKGVSATYRSNLRLQDFLDAIPGIKR